MGNKKIKLIWDFRGPEARSVAMHYQAHLQEYLATETAASPKSTGQKDLSSTHSIAFMIVEESQLARIRDALQPHRGERYEE